MKPEIIEYEDHPKGWGHERWIVNKEKYCLKILSFNALPYRKRRNVVCI